VDFQHPRTDERSIYDQAMGRLRVAIKVLGAVLIALIARTVVDGPSVAGALAEALIVVLLVASAGLWRCGRRLEPPAGSSPHALSPGGCERGQREPHLPA